jgi:hypothetical protein
VKNQSGFCFTCLSFSLGTTTARKTNEIFHTKLPFSSFLKLFSSFLPMRNLNLV